MSVPDTFTSVANESLFDCRSVEDGRGIEGVSLTLLRNITSESELLCAWAGSRSDCTENGLVAFIAEQAEDGYAFAFGGYSIETAERREVHVPSAPYLDGDLVLVGRRTLGRKSVWNRLWQPFRTGAWVIVAVFLVVFFFISILVAQFFRMATPEDDFIAATLAVVTHRLRAHTSDSHGATTPAQRNERNRLIAVTSLMRISMVWVFLIVAVLYESAVVNFLFSQSSPELPQNVRVLDVDRLERYAVSRETAIEDIWNQTVFEPGKYKTQDGQPVFPWRRCVSDKDCVDLLLDSTADDETGVEFVVLSDISAKELFRIGRLTTDEHAIFETKETLLHFSGGWLYPIEPIPEDTRVDIDYQIMQRKIDQFISQSVPREIREFDGSTPAAIVPGIIGIPIAVFSGLPLLVALAIAFSPKNAP